MLRQSTRLLLVCFAWLLSVGICASNSPAQSPAQRKLAPGVLVTIPPAMDPDDTVSTHDVVELRTNQALQWNPEYLAVSDTLHGMSAGVKFRRAIWGLEFSFKPMRLIEVDGKQVWYLVYRVRNTGQSLEPVEGEGGVYTANPGKGDFIRFIPQFVLESHDLTSSGEPIRQAYLDQIIPAAVKAIEQREMRGGKLLNTVEMAEQPIPVSGDRIDRGVWGVATWTDIDPRIDFFSVYVGGLTNAYRWEDVAGAYRVGDPPGKGRRFARKTLQLNFWRPGDELLQSEREIRYGVPLGQSDLYGVKEGVAHQWVYR